MSLAHLLHPGGTRGPVLLFPVFAFTFRTSGQLLGARTQSLRTLLLPPC